MKTAVITGVSRGIGRATAEKFLREGWAVIGTSTAGSCPWEHAMLRVYSLDLRVPAHIKAFAGEAVKAGGRLHVLVNNAGISLQGDEGKTFPAEVLRETLEVNLVGLIDLTERLLPAVIEGGHIINVSSGLGSLSDNMGSFAPAYSISKAALNMYTRKLAAGLRKRRIIVSSIDPGWVRTDMGGGGAPRDPSEPAVEIYSLATSIVDSGYFWHRGHKRSW